MNAGPFRSACRDHLPSFDAAVSYIEERVAAGRDVFEMSGIHFVHQRDARFSVLTVLLPASLYDGPYPWVELHGALGVFAASAPFANLVGAVGVCVEPAPSVVDLHIEVIGHHRHKSAVVDADGRIGTFHPNERPFDEGRGWPVCLPYLPANRACYEAECRTLGT